MARPATAAGEEVPPGFGVYVHVPFCASRCDYCAFATWSGKHHLASAYVDACITEYRRAADAGLEEAHTIFLGGGTPSQLRDEDLVRLVSVINRRPEAEITVEANPEDVTPEWLESCLAAGVNRISLGVQSLDPTVLVGLGRRHDPAAVTTASAAIGTAGIARYSVDLIYGGAGETDESWLRTLQAVLSLEPRPGHVSAYALTVEPGTPLWGDADRHPDDDIQATRYAMADEVLSAAGLSWYEISNWSLPGHECRHNMNYWLQGDYRGIGCAAHSHRAGHRWWNLRTPERYIDAVGQVRSTVAVSETLPDPERTLESLQLLLRTRHGVPTKALSSALAGTPELRRLVRVDASTGRATLTLDGRLLANEVCHRLDSNGLKVTDIRAPALASNPWPNRSSG
jgi:oxygen-independent coproporphyrinogen-3 oxidase